jgi:hypothetical protein
MGKCLSGIIKKGIIPLTMNEGIRPNEEEIRR